MPRTLALVVTLAVAAAPLAGQVGFAPDRSPYRDITRPSGLLFQYGHLGGNGGSLGVGPHDGDGWNLRYDVHLSGLLGAHLGFGHFSGVRDAYYPDDSAATRRRGPYTQGVTFIGAGMQATLTGAKMWHHLAPYLDTEIGAAIGSTVAADTASAYAFGTKLYLAPSVGVQWFASPRLRLRFDAKFVYWKLNYPVSFFQVPLADPTADPIIPSGGSNSAWTATSWLTAGLFFSF
jgi:hypothetical protein